MVHLEDDAEIDRAQLERLLGDPRAALEYRILRATRRLLGTRGLAVSMDEIAAEAGVGRRTVFRYCSSRDELVARALSDSLRVFSSQVTTSTSSHLPLGEWVLQVVTELQRSQVLAGTGMWQLAAADDRDLPGPIAAVNRRRRVARRKMTREIADAAWSRAGGEGSAPQDVEHAVAHSISSFTVHSLISDYGSTAQDTAGVVARMLHDFLVARVGRS